MQFNKMWGGGGLAKDLVCITVGCDLGCSRFGSSSMLLLPVLVPVHVAWNSMFAYEMEATSLGLDEFCNAEIDDLFPRLRRTFVDLV